MRHQVMDVDFPSALVRASAEVGRVVRITADGEVLVDFAENPGGPIRARIATSSALDEPNQQVLLIFEGGDVNRPIIVGAIKERADTSARKKLALQSTEELTIACGKSSITMRSDGRVVVKGSELMSRASGTNKIRGASVKIN